MDLSTVACTWTQTWCSHLKVEEGRSERVSELVSAHTLPARLAVPVLPLLTS